MVAHIHSLCRFTPHSSKDISMFMNFIKECHTTNLIQIPQLIEFIQVHTCKSPYGISTIINSSCVVMCLNISNQAKGLAIIYFYFILNFFKLIYHFIIFWQWGLLWRDMVSPRRTLYIFMNFCFVNSLQWVYDLLH